jgi:RNA polymerase subunit RPABC4/transcription elongation factor Spt4
MDTEKISILLWILYFCVIIYVVLETEDYCRLRKKQRIKRNANKQIENEAVEEKSIEESNTYYCDNCGGIVDEFDTTCPHCELDFVEEQPVDESNLYYCDNCGAIVDETDTSCPHCGLDFVVEDEEDEDDSYEFDYDYVYNPLKFIKEEKKQEKIIQKEFIDIKFMNNDKIYTYLAPDDKKMKQGDYYLVYLNGRKQPVEIVRENYLKTINQDYIYKSLDILKKIDENEATGNKRVIEPSSIYAYWNKKYRSFPRYWKHYSDYDYDTIARREEYMMGETGQHYIPEFYFSEYDDIFTTQPVDEDDRSEINYNDYMMDEVMDDEFRGFFDEAKSYD